MKNFVTLLLCVFVTLSLNAQKTLISVPFDDIKAIPIVALETPDMTQIILEDDAREKNGELYRIGTSISTNINPSYTGDWKINNDGSRTWKLRVKVMGAEALSFLFSKFELFGQSKLEIRNTDGYIVHKPMTQEDVFIP